MNLNKLNKQMLTVGAFLVAFGIGSSLTARADPLPFIGHYASSVKGDDESPIDRRTDLAIKQEGAVYRMLIGSIWIPGAVIDIQAEVPANDVVVENGANGVTTYTLNFPFQDSFENGGTGRVVITNNEALLTLTVELRNADAEISHRATRQYDGEIFRLAKSNE